MIKADFEEIVKHDSANCDIIKTYINIAKEARIMKQYKIGEVSKIVDIPVESIRFFESKGLITPGKKEFSKYRYYDEEDINRLYDYKKYRNMGFSSNESVEIVNSADFETFISNLSQKQKEAEKKSRYYELKSIKLQNHQNVLRNIPLLLGEYILVNRPAGYYFINRYYKDGSMTFDRAEEWKGYFDELLSYYIFVENIYRVKKEWFDNPTQPEEFQWGFTIKKKWSDALGIAIKPKMEEITRVKSIYTVLEVEEGKMFSPKLMEPILEYMKKRGYELDGDILGNIVAVVQKNNKRVRYMEVWVPIRENTNSIVIEEYKKELFEI